MTTLALKDTLRRSLNRFLAPTDARIYSLLRILLGIFLLLRFLDFWPSRSFYFAPDGWFNLKLIEVHLPGSWGLSWISHPQGFYWILVVGIVGSIAMIFGVFSRLANLIVFSSITILFRRNWMVFYGGDRVCIIYLFYLLLTPSGQVWSVDRWLRSRIFKDHKDPSPCLSVARGWPLRLMQMQLALIYWATGVSKLNGLSWVNGTAVSYALMNPTFRRYDLSELFACQWFVFFIYASTWLVLGWEITFPLLILWRQTRRVALAVGIVVHVGIALILEVWLFSPIMLTTYLAFLPPTFLLLWERKIRAWFILSRRGKRKSLSPAVTRRMDEARRLSWSSLWKPLLARLFPPI